MVAAHKCSWWSGVFLISFAPSKLLAFCQYLKVAVFLFCREFLLICGGDLDIGKHGTGRKRGNEVWINLLQTLLLQIINDLKWSFFFFFGGFFLISELMPLEVACVWHVIRCRLFSGWGLTLKVSQGNHCCKHNYCCWIFRHCSKYDQ